ncbi:MAG: SAM-dependent chlorinase/fluorinase [Prevotellaceae bacterium]|jgi:S-adenosylmethionine hydrolase|nr:SAM-dependent chlorinase/fluorinase [Prevotellaceae bacterium]
MPIVTLTTDWGTSDFYVAALKGQMLSMCPEAHIVDISHDASYLGNLAQAAYNLRNAYACFPEGSVHVVGLDSEADPSVPFVAAESNRQLFICKNNGFLSLALDGLDSATAIAQPAEQVAEFSAMLHAVPPAVKKLLQGAPASSLGEAVALHAITPQQPIVKFEARRDSAVEQGAKSRVSTITGHILYIDRHGNAITNITRELFGSSAQGRRHSIFIASNRYEFSQVGNTYADVRSGMPVIFFNSQELLEVAIRYGNASHLYGLSAGSSIFIKFQD